MTRKRVTALFAALGLCAGSIGSAGAQSYLDGFREDEPLSRIGTMTLVGDVAGRQMDIWIDDVIVFSGYRELSLSGAPFSIAYNVEMFPALVAVKIRGCTAPVMMEMEGPQPVVVINDCDIGMYVDQV